MEHRAGIEPANAGFADLSVSHFATGARSTRKNLPFISRTSLASVLPKMRPSGPGQRTDVVTKARYTSGKIELDLEIEI